MNIFEYGELQWRDLWEHQVRSQYSEKNALVKGYRCRKIKKESYPALIRAPHSPNAEEHVSGKVYFDVSPYDFEQIKSYHGKQYEIIDGVCFTPDSDIPLDCKIFMWKPEHRSLLSSHDWTKEWFEEKALNAYRRDINQSLF